MIHCANGNVFDRPANENETDHRVRRREETWNEKKFINKQLINTLIKNKLMS